PPRPGVVGRSRRAAGRAAALLVRRRRTQRRHRPRGRAQAVGDGVAARRRLRAGVVPAWPVGRAGGGRRARADRAARARARPRARRAALLIPPPMRPDRLLAMLCLTTGLQTFSIGAFPALLPELGRGAALADWQLGAVAGAFGLARMLADLPAGLLMTHHVRRALIAGPAVVLAGMACLVLGGSFGWLVLGRVLMGAGHTLGTLGALTTILRVRAERRLASALSALEFSAMLGILGGVTLVGALPGALAWQTAFLVACSPILVALVALKALLVLLPDDGGDRPWFARSAAAAEASPRAADRGASALAFAAGGAVALAYATLEQFVIPVRGSREFGLERSGIAHLLMLAQLCDP